MFRIITTVGPALLNNVPLPNGENNDLIFRINGAHGSVEDIKNYVKNIRKQLPNSSILMDLPGNKVRTSGLSEGIKLVQGGYFYLGFSNCNYSDFYSHLKHGDIVWANDSTFEFEVVEIDNDKQKIKFLSKSNGILLNNKGLHVRGIHEKIPFLFEKDKKLIELANEMNLELIGLSFVRNAGDILLSKSLIKPDIKIISKVETLAAVQNLESILQEVSYILVDRGDLSTEVGLENVPQYQKYILRISKAFGTKVFLATQFLKNMEKNPVPSIPEVLDLFTTIDQGVYGIQLSEETAVGKYPLECIEFVRSLNNNINIGLCCFE